MSAIIEGNDKSLFSVYLSQYILGITGTYNTNNHPTIANRSEEQLAASALGLYDSFAKKEPRTLLEFQNAMGNMKEYKS